MRGWEHGVGQHEGGPAWGGRAVWDGVAWELGGDGVVVVGQHEGWWQCPI